VAKCVEQVSENGTFVLVNPVSGKIYSFQPSNTPVSYVPVDQTTTVAVEMPPDEFAHEFENGLYYSDSDHAFYRGWNTKQNLAYAYVSSGSTIQIMTPNIADSFMCGVTLSKEETGQLVLQSQIPIVNGVGSFTFPDLDEGRYTFRAYSEDYGRLTIEIHYIPQQVAEQVTETEQYNQFIGLNKTLSELTKLINSGELTPEMLQSIYSDVLNQQKFINSISEEQKEQLKQIPSQSSSSILATINALFKQISERNK